MISTIKLIDRYQISNFLNNMLMGLLEGTSKHLHDLTKRRLKEQFNINLQDDQIKIIIDDLKNPDRHCWSIHIDYADEHYESVIVNMGYYNGADDY
jgi:hypothetical protein